jgi:hypothetical protein
MENKNSKFNDYELEDFTADHHQFIKIENTLNSEWMSENYHTEAMEEDGRDELIRNLQYSQENCQLFAPCMVNNIVGKPLKSKFKIPQPKEPYSSTNVSPDCRSNLRSFDIKESFTQNGERSGSICPSENQHSSAKEKIKHRIKEMRTNTENYLEGVKNCFLSYIENQKSQVLRSLSTIETIYLMQSANPKDEEEKIKQLEKKMTDLKQEVQLIVNDLSKLTK